MIWVALVCGVGVGVGVLVALGGLLGWPMFGSLFNPLRLTSRRVSLRFGLMAGLGLLTLLATGWPVAGALAAVFGFVAPSLLSGSGNAKKAIERTEAIANWTEMLRDTMAGAAGLQSAIDATSKASPVAIRIEVERLAQRMKHGSFDDALRGFANDLDHPTADLVVASLLLAANRHAKNLGVMLSALSEAARDDATMRLRVEAGRARTRTSVQVVVGFSLAMALGLLILNRTYLQPYDSATGQFVLALVGASFIGAFAWMNKVASIGVPSRILIQRSEAV